MKPKKEYFDDIGGRLVNLVVDHARWSQATFGDDFDKGPEGPIQHLIEEAHELLENPQDRHEAADCFILLLDSYRRAGGNIYDLILAAEEKLEICKNRKWAKPDEKGISRHIEEYEREA